MLSLIVLVKLLLPVMLSAVVLASQTDSLFAEVEAPPPLIRLLSPLVEPALSLANPPVVLLGTSVLLLTAQPLSATLFMSLTSSPA